MAWNLFEPRDIDRICRGLMPAVLKNYEAWKALVLHHGMAILKSFPGYHDEKLKGKWAGHRSSRLSGKYRVIYRVDASTKSVYVEDINPHDY